MLLRPKHLLEITQTFAISMTVGAFFALDTNTTFGLWAHWALIVLALLILSLISWYVYRDMARERRYVLQGENIKDYLPCGFGKSDDPDDESGEILVNLDPQWKLIGKLGSLGRSGAYLANIRYKCLKELDAGGFVFKLYTGSGTIAEYYIDLKEYPINHFAYKDVIFDYDGISDIHFEFAPDENARIDRILGFDRLEAYYLPNKIIDR